MQKQRVDKYAAEEILKGKSHQEVYDYIVSTSHFKIHDIAEIVRKIPSPEKRIKYGSLNLVLIVILFMSVLDKVYVAINAIKLGEHLSNVLFAFPIISLLLLYGVYKYKRNVHLWAALIMILSAITSIGKIISQANVFIFIGVLVTIIGIIIAFYLSVKLPADYIFDIEQQKRNPSQREGLIKFVD